MPMPIGDKKDVYRCPACKVAVEPQPTGKKLKDTDKVEVEVYECPTEGCEYTEGRPVPKTKKAKKK